MDATRSHTTRRTIARTLTALLGSTLAGLAAAPALSLTTPPVTGSGAIPESPCCEAAAASSPGAVSSSPAAATSSDEDQRPAPDATADGPGGIAARVRTTDGRPLPGNVFMLMAVAGSDNDARLYDQTPYTHDNGTAADSYESNVAANDTVETITGTDIELLELTTAPAGGPSAGITYTIAYLNVISDGAFTGELRVAATGRIDKHGYVGPINAIAEKTAAAHLADADVLFTASTPTDGHLAAYAARHIGERDRARNTGTPLADERQLDNYETWGNTRPDGMDIIHVRHIADVAAYLCGTGSTYACHITDHLKDTTTEFSSDQTDTGDDHHHHHAIAPAAIR